MDSSSDDETTRGGASLKCATTEGDNEKSPWQCQVCTFLNEKMEAPVCEMCQRPRTGYAAGQEGQSSSSSSHNTSSKKRPRPDEGWVCTQCTLLNSNMDAPVCEACQKPRDPGNNDHTNDRHNTNKKKTRPMKGSRELANLCDHNRPGLDGHGANTGRDDKLSEVVGPSRAEAGGRSSRRNRFDVVVERSWCIGECNGDGAPSRPSPPALPRVGAPVHFRRNLADHPLPDDVLSLKDDVMAEARRLTDDGTGELPQPSCKVRDARVKRLETGGFAGYHKAHFCNDAAVIELGRRNVPEPFAINGKADQKAMAFINLRAGICHTHADRDNSMLWVIQGRKTVKLTMPIQRSDRTLGPIQDNSTHFDFEPFEKDNEGGMQWKTIQLETGDALYLPKNFLHAVKSEEGTFALSFQVQRASR